MLGAAGARRTALAVATPSFLVAMVGAFYAGFAGTPDDWARGRTSPAFSSLSRNTALLSRFCCFREIMDDECNDRPRPISIMVCLFICFAAYFGISAILTLMIPYYDCDPNAPLPEAFADVGWVYAKYIIAVGAICGLSSR